MRAAAKVTLVKRPVVHPGFGKPKHPPTRKVIHPSAKATLNLVRAARAGNPKARKVVFNTAAHARAGNVAARHGLKLLHAASLIIPPGLAKRGESSQVSEEERAEAVETLREESAPQTVALTESAAPDEEKAEAMQTIEEETGEEDEVTEETTSEEELPPDDEGDED